MPREIRAIAAMGLNGELGLNGHLPWKHPEDLELFKAHTQGSIMIMGAQTWRSLPKPLALRDHWILSTGPRESDLAKAQTCAQKERIRFFATKDAVLSALREEPDSRSVFVIGGAQIYKLFEQECSEWIITHFQSSFKADCFFPMDLLNQRLVLSTQECLWPSLEHYKAHLIHYGAKNDGPSTV